MKWRVWGRTGTKKWFKSDSPTEDEKREREKQLSGNSENDIVRDIHEEGSKISDIAVESNSSKPSRLALLLGRNSKQKGESHNSVSRLAFGLFGGKIPSIPHYKEVYERAAMPLVYEVYLSTGIFLSFVLMGSSFVASLLLEMRFLPYANIGFAVLGSVVLGGVVCATTYLLWLTYPIFRRRNIRSSLESQLAYSFGILGVLSAAGMTLDKLFERVAISESNPVLAELARRFLRNVRLIGLDSESAIREVAVHSPSEAFTAMLDSIAVAHKTTGSIHDLVMFESSRLLRDKSDSLRRSIASLSVIAEMYITLVVVGPIIFIVMLAIFGLLPTGGLPNPIFLINLIVFIGIPVLSVMFVILLDSVVSKP